MHVYLTYMYQLTQTRSGDRVAWREFIILPSVAELWFSSERTSKMDSAATIPLFMALWVPFILGTFMKPGLQPIRQPPGNASLGMHCQKNKILHKQKLLQIVYQNSALYAVKFGRDGLFSSTIEADYSCEFLVGRKDKLPTHVKVPPKCNDFWQFCLLVLLNRSNQSTSANLKLHVSSCKQQPLGNNKYDNVTGWTVQTIPTDIFLLIVFYHCKSAETLYIVPKRDLLLILLLLLLFFLLLATIYLYTLARMAFVYLMLTFMSKTILIFISNF